MRTVGPIVILLIAGGFGYWLGYSFADPASSVHAVVIQWASIIFGLAGTYFGNSMRKQEDLKKATLDEKERASMIRKLTRRKLRIAIRYAIGLIAATAAVSAATLLKADKLPVHAGMGYGGLAVILVVFCSFLVENIYLGAQLEQMENAARDRKKAQKFRERTTGVC